MKGLYSKNEKKKKKPVNIVKQKGRLRKCSRFKETNKMQILLILDGMLKQNRNGIC